MNAQNPFPALPAGYRTAVGQEIQSDSLKSHLAAWQDSITANEDPQARTLLESFSENESGKALLRTIFYGSSFLSEVLRTEPTLICRTFADPQATLDALRQEVQEIIQDEAIKKESVQRALRIARKRHSLVVALLEISGAWKLEQLTAELSHFARTTLEVAVHFSLNKFVREGRIDTPNPKRCGYAVMLLGKGGADELNYSSDIDFMVLFDETHIVSRSRRALQQELNLLTGELISLLQDRTADGYVYRCDMRLRPDPGATPLAVSLRAAIQYYQTRGQNWERCAMIKISVAAGDKTLAAEFMREMNFYVWRKYLDFWAIQDIHSIKRQFHSGRAGTDDKSEMLGRNIKLGGGGIREVEFFVQTQQLIWGGRNTDLRTPRTLEALAALATAERISHQAKENLQDAYRFLRHLEHRLQMVEDRQTQELPRNEADLERLALFFGFESGAALLQTLSSHLEKVRKHYAELFQSDTSLAESGNLVFTGTEPEPGTLETLSRLGYQDGAAVFSLISKWHHGGYRTTATVRARQALTELVPSLLQAFADTQSPDETLRNFDELIARMPAGFHLFGLLLHNRELLTSLAEILGLSPLLASQLTHRPQLAYSMLDGDFFSRPPSWRKLRRELQSEHKAGRDFEDSLMRLRHRINDRRFQINFQMLHGLLSARKAEQAAASLAECTLRTLLPFLRESFQEAHGVLPSPYGFSVVALGRLGAGAMGPTSDLDLVFLYDEQSAEETSNGARPLTGSIYWGRLARRIQTVLSADSSFGAIYDVDARLRPHGSNGPIAISLATWREYHSPASQDGSAWLWERMPLIRARALYGGSLFRKEVRAFVQQVLCRPEPAEKWHAETARMRDRVRKEHKPRGLLDLRYGIGGLSELDLLGQMLMLIHAPKTPQVLQRNTETGFRVLAETGVLSEGDGAFLAETVRLFENLRWYLQMVDRAAVHQDRIGTGLAQGLLRVAERSDYSEISDLLKDVETRRQRAGGLLDSIVGEASA